jgi:hypothetical protein
MISPYRASCRMRGLVCGASNPSPRRNTNSFAAAEYIVYFMDYSVVDIITEERWGKHY